MRNFFLIYYQEHGHRALLEKWETEDFVDQSHWFHESILAILGGEFNFFDLIKCRFEINGDILSEWVAALVRLNTPESEMRAISLLSEHSDLLPIEGFALQDAVSQNKLGLFGVLLISCHHNEQLAFAFRASCIEPHCAPMHFNEHDVDLNLFQKTLIELCSIEIIERTFKSEPSQYYVNLFKQHKSKLDKQDLDSQTQSVSKQVSQSRF